MILKVVNQTKTVETQGYRLLFFKDYETDQREADKKFNFLYKYLCLRITCSKFIDMKKINQ